MKMNWWTAFWGLFFVFLGVSIFLKAFGVDIPVFRVFAAILVIGIGIKILMPGSCDPRRYSRSTDSETLFAENKISGTNTSGNHRVVFGNAELDLRDVNLAGKNIEYHYDVVFGALKIKINSQTPIRIAGDAVFAGISVPNGNSTAFGHVTYTSSSFQENAPAIRVTLKTVFGGVEVE